MASRERTPDQTVNGVRVGSFVGVPVYIGWSWLLLAALVTWLYGQTFERGYPQLGMMAYAASAAVAVGFLVSVLVHEAAHALSARAFGLRVRRIVADVMGGHTAFDGRTTPWSQGVTALSGPVGTLVAAAGFWLAGLAVSDGVVAEVLGRLVFINLILAVFNMLPGLPLDGGQVLMAAVWRLTGSQHTAAVVAGWSGRVVAVLVVVGFMAPALLAGRTPSLFTVFLALFVASFMWRGASQSILVGRTRSRVDRTPLHRVLRPVTVVAESAPIRSWWQGPDRVYVTADGRGDPSGIVRPDVVASVPEAQWESVPASAVSVTAPQGWVSDFAEDPALGDVLAAMGQAQTDVLLVCRDGEVAGVVFAGDALRAIE